MKNRNNTRITSHNSGRLRVFSAALGLATSFLALSACSDDGEESSSGDTQTLTYNFSSLSDLGDNYVYEGWFIDDDGPISTGRFTVDGSGVTSPDSFSVDADDVAAANLFVLTIEPKEGDDPAPAATHILAAEMVDGTITLTTDHEAAIDTDFADAAGTYLLTTPTNEDETPDQGIWWVSPGDDPPSSLVLPELPAGWVYEGWIVDEDGPVSTGRFLDPAMADDDGAGPAKGPVGDGPPVPGQDFIDPAKSLPGTTAVISVEPEPDNDSGPFLIKPLTHNPIGPDLAPDAQTMENTAADTLPAGTVTIE